MSGQKKIAVKDRMERIQPLAYSERRQYEYDYLRWAVKNRLLTAAEFNDEIKKLNREQLRVDRQRMKRRQQSEQKQQEKIRREEERRREVRAEAAKKAAATRAAKKAATKAIVFSTNVTIGTDIESPEIYAIAQRIIEQGIKEFRLILLANGVNVREHVFQVTTNRASALHHDLRFFYFWTGSDATNTVFAVDKDGRDYATNTSLVLQVLRPSEIVAPKKITQAYRDGNVHCVAEPLALLWEQMANTASSPSTKKRALQRVRAIRAFGLKYDNGIPEGEPMEEIARIAARRIVITDILNNTYQEYNSKSSHVFRFINTREHHIDVGHICINEAPTIVSQLEMDQIVTDHAKEFYLFEGQNGSERCLRSARGAWRIENELHDKYKRHNEENMIREFGLNAKKYPKINQFLKRSAIVNAVPVKLSDCIPTRHHDLKAAYTQHELTGKYFKGFLGKIHQWRNVSDQPASFVEENLGIYEFEVASIPNHMLATLGLVAGNRYILPSPEIMFFRDQGVEIHLINAVLGARTEITYSEEMMESKAYATWAGCMSHDQPMKEFNFNGTKKWAAHLMDLLGKDNVWFNAIETAQTHRLKSKMVKGRRIYTKVCIDEDMKGCITVRIPKNAHYTCHHILAFITSYTRINILTALMKLKNPCYVVLDGIYHADDDINLGAEFRTKEFVAHEHFGAGWYDPIEEEYDFPPLDPAYLKNCVLAGAGGTGKTHSIMTDAGWNDVLYVVPQHMLGRSMAETYNAHYTTMHRLIGIDCLPYAAQQITPPVILIDEITMLNKEWIEKAISIYRFSRILCAGDICNRDGFRWFQCRSGKPGAWAELWKGDGFAWKYYEVDRRSTDDGMRAMKESLRQQMRKVFTDGGIADSSQIANWVCANYKIKSYADAISMFTPGDTWIAGTHQTNKRLLDCNIISGWLSKQNEKSDIEVAGWEKRGSFTTHSYQGQTIRTGRVFVSINDAFELAMIYTAVSRAVSIDQIVFVD